MSETKAKILIVDDQPLAHTVMKTLLVKEGYDLIFASSGAEALAKAKELTPDLILLDIMMPDMNGFEVCEQIRLDPLLALVPIIMLTALDDNESRLQAIEAGADDFISKPFNRVELRARVRTIARLNRYRRLHSERAKFEWVVEHTEDGYLVINHLGQIEYANPQARFYLGLSPNSTEAIAETFVTLARKQYNLQPEELWVDWPASAANINAPAYLVRSESSIAKTFWLEVNAMSLPGQLEKEWGIRLQNVTEHMTLRRDMRSFHNHIHHKLRTPLNWVIPTMRKLANDAPKLFSETIAQRINLAYEGIKRLHREIEDILQYLNVPVIGKSDNPFILTEFELLITELSNLFDLETVHISISESLKNATLPLPKRNIELILRELLENAQKFHPQQKPIVEINVSEVKNHAVCIQVIDDGLHLSPEQINQVWTPYYQGEKYFTGEVPGMGLGLPMVASLVWSVGGSCHFYNRPDKTGIIVEIILPYN